MARKKKQEESQAGAPAWMMTYGDLVTQMLTFFILLFTFSSLDAVKFRDAVISLQGAFGVLSGGTQILNLSDMPTSTPNKQETTPMMTPKLLQVKNLLDQVIIQSDQITEEAQNQNTKDKDKDEDQPERESEPLILTELDERGLRIRFTDPVLFDLGSADLKIESVDILRQVADILAPLPNRITVEGHTDNIPIQTSQFKSNRFLSSARACQVVDFLVKEGGVPPDRLTAAGQSEYHPLLPNDTKANREKNRRVEILIMNESPEDSTTLIDDTIFK